jgi:DhnA family fructose-bisphosphate aldolase class Ia
MDIGAHGTAVGRNVWQDSKPKSLSRGIAHILFDKGTVEKAVSIYNEGHD